MRILHTADWHLGKKLDAFSRLEEQRLVLDEICRIAEEQQVDAVLVAGDLFDAYNPPTEAAELLYRTLKRLTRNGSVPVIAIAGNHDSPDRVNVADVLARVNGIVFIGHPTDVVPLFEVENGFRVTKSEVGFIEIELPKYPYPLRLLHTAFANEVRLKEYFGEDKQVSLQESLAGKWQLLADRYCDALGVNVLTTHLYMAPVQGALPDEPDGEKPLHIGNADLVRADVIPEQIDYVALGHLHRFQDVGAHQPVIYSGSPLQYSFSEAEQQKFVVVLDMVPGQKPQIQKIPLSSGKQLKRVKFDSVECAVEWLSANGDTLVELTLKSDEYIKADEQQQIYRSHSGIVHLIPQVNKKNLSEEVHDIDLNRDMEDLFRDYFRSKKGGQEPSEELIDLFKELLS